MPFKSSSAIFKKLPTCSSMVELFFDTMSVADKKKWL